MEINEKTSTKALQGAALGVLVFILLSSSLYTIQPASAKKQNPLFSVDLLVTTNNPIRVTCAQLIAANRARAIRMWGWLRESLRRWVGRHWLVCGVSGKLPGCCVCWGAFLIGVGSLDLSIIHQSSSLITLRWNSG